MSPIPGEPLKPKAPELSTSDGRKFKLKLPGPAPQPGATEEPGRPEPHRDDRRPPAGPGTRRRLTRGRCPRRAWTSTTPSWPRITRISAPPTGSAAGESVLDVGCGCGNTTNRLAAERAGEVLGVDLSAAHAREGPAAVPAAVRPLPTCASSRPTPMGSATFRTRRDLVMSQLRVNVLRRPGRRVRQPAPGRAAALASPLAGSVW